MDLSHSVSFDAVCPICSTRIIATQWHVVDVDARPDLVAHGGDGSLQRTFCSTCIGPGIERPAPFICVRHAEGKAQFVDLLPMTSAQDQPAIEARLAALVERCEAYSISREAIEPLGAARCDSGDDFRRAIERRWPEVKIGFDMTMVRGPLADLLNAIDVEARVKALLEFTDLARPNIERLLAQLAATQQGAQRVAAVEAIRVLTEVRSLGAFEVLRRQQAGDRGGEENDAVRQCRELLALSASLDEQSEGDKTERIERALGYALRAVALGPRVYQDLLAEAHMEVGILYTRRLIGDTESNLALAREALQNARRLAVDPGLKTQAQYNEALTYVEAETGDVVAQLTLGIAILGVLVKPDARALFNDAQQQNLHQSLGVALANRFSRQSGRDPEELRQAARHIEQARALAQSRGQPIESARLASLLAAVAADLRRNTRSGRDLAEIIHLLDEADRVFTLETAPFDFASNQLRRAGVLTDLAEPELASSWIVRALEAASRVYTPDAAPRFCRSTQFQLGRQYLREGDHTAAAKAFAVASAAAENVLVATESTTRRAEEGDVNVELYGNYVDALARVAETSQAGSSGAHWELLEAMEKGRARLYLDRMGLRRLPEFAGIPPDLLARERTLLATLSGEDDAGVPSPLPGKGDFEGLHRRRDARLALQTLWDEIAETGSGGRRHVALRRAQPPNRSAMASLTAALGQSVGVLSFFVLPDRILGVLLRDGSAPRLESIALDTVRFGSQFFDPFTRDITARLPRRGTQKPEGDDWPSLGEELFAPFMAALADATLLILVPHGHLHRLPLHALNVGGEPLISRLAITYAPSLGVLLSLEEAAAPQSPVETSLVLSHATSDEEAASFEGEANDVAALLGVRARHHASKTAVVDGAPRARVAHLSCHGYFDRNDPLQSGVVLADGVMTAREWLALMLRAQLVTLSACETGVQQVRSGDELQGFGRVLLEAGSTGVLLTLWNVASEPTVEWMHAFYRRLGAASSGTFPMAHAFQAATLALRERDSDPLLWAPFVLMGRPA